jgi:hypothetical protein
MRAWHYFLPNYFSTRTSFTSSVYLITMCIFFRTMWSTETGSRSGSEKETGYSYYIPLKRVSRRSPFLSLSWYSTLQPSRKYSPGLAYS